MLARLSITIAPLAVALLNASVLTGCCPPVRRSLEESQLTTWIPSERGRARGTVLVIHGLNQDARAMGPLSNAVKSAGYDVHLLTLSGHTDGQPESASAAIWIEDVRNALSVARGRSAERPIHILAYSIGALAAVRAIDIQPDLRPASMVLLAPAYSLRPVSHLTRLFGWLGGTSLRVPSFTPQAYRAHRAIPSTWYSALFELLDDSSRLKNPDRFKDIPALILVSPRDELVSPNGISSWIERNGLEMRWSIEKLSPAPPNPRSYEHLVIDEENLGADEWARMTGRIRRFFEESD